MRALMILSCLVLLALAASGYAQVSNANDAATQSSHTGVSDQAIPTVAIPNLHPPLDAAGAQATAQAAATLAVNYVNQYPGAEQTAQAALNLAAAAGSNPDAVAATVEAYSTQFAVDPLYVADTVGQLLEEVPADTDTEELEAALYYWFSLGNVSVEVQGDTLLVTVVYSETAVNAILAAELAAMDYAVTSISVDLVPGGVVLDLIGYETGVGRTGDVRLYALLTAVEGRIQVDLVSASFNGKEVPARTLDQIETLLIQGVSNALYIYMGVMLNTDMPYSVDTLTITDTDFMATLTIPLVE